MEEKYTTCSPVSQPVAWLIWFLVTIFYFYEYFLRAAPSVMESGLSQFFHLTSAGLGSLIGAYYYTYAPLQIVAGVAMDRFGGRKVVPFAVMLCALGSWLFISPSLWVATTGRMLIGAGSACAFVSVIFIATNWISRKHLALLTGLTQTCGMLGAIFGQKYVEVVMKHYSWQTIWVQSFIFGSVLAVILYFIIPKRPLDIQQRIIKQGYGHIRQNLKSVLKNKQTWLVGIYGGCIFLPTTILAMIWAVPFFQDSYHLPLNQITNLSSMLFAGWIVGAPLMGLISDHAGNRKHTMAVGILLTFVLMMTILYIPQLPDYMLVTCMFLTGIFSGAELIAIAYTCEVNPVDAKGAAIGVTNFIIFSFSALIAPLVGILLYWSNSYKLALLVIPVCLLAGLIAILFANEPQTKQDILTMGH
jgi:MFS family permease